MPLVLSLKKGQDFYIGDERFLIDEVYSETHFRVRRERTDKMFEITDTRATEIMPDVFVSAGERPQPLMARIAIEAPPNVLVLRGDKFRNPPSFFRGRQHR